jgi:predicted GNAT family acetyltransferase
MRCETTADASEFWDRASGFLLADPVMNNIIVTNVAARRDRAVTDPAPATYAAVLDGTGAVVGAAMRTPPFAVVVSPMPPAAVTSLVEAMEAACPDAAGVNGPAAEARGFAAAWAARTGAGVRVERHERVYRLDAVVRPPAPPGAWRLAALADRDLLVTWSEAFIGEVGVTSSGSVARDVERRIADGRAFLWVDRETVSFVGASRLAGGVVRIGPVYTPPGHRRRGYAGALVAAVSQRALDDGAALCSLYTDLANPTSNSVYMSVGYRPVADAAAYRFTSAGGTTRG